MLFCDQQDDCNFLRLKKNRQSAASSRLKRKFQKQNLQSRLQQLTQENNKLKQQAQHCAVWFICIKCGKNCTSKYQSSVVEFASKKMDILNPSRKVMALGLGILLMGFLFSSQFCQLWQETGEWIQKQLSQAGLANGFTKNLINLQV